MTKVWVLEYTSEQLRGVIEKKIQLDVRVWQNYIGLDSKKGEKSHIFVELTHDLHDEGFEIYSTRPSTQTLVANHLRCIFYLTPDMTLYDRQRAMVKKLYDVVM